MRLRRLLAAGLVAACTWATPAFGQSQAINGTIEGTVTDAQGGVLPGVTVTLTNVDTGQRRVVVTNDTGTYRAPLLPLGGYKIEYLLSGFAKHARSGITLAAGQTVVLNETLRVGVQEEILVTADTPPVDLAKTDVGRNLTEREIKNLPMTSRNPFNFALLEPGVTGFENEEFGVPRFAVNGQMTRINYQVDGNTNTQKDRAGLRLIPISEVMIREVQVVSSGYAPEFGQTTGLVYNAVTPSGSNRYTGDVGYRFRLKKWAAFPFFFTQPKTEENRPDNSLSIFTGTVSGPVLKNRLFFYGGVERTYQAQDRVITVDPSVIQAVGAAEQPGSIPGYRSVFFFIGKADWQINASHRLSFRTNTFKNDNPFNASTGGANTYERAVDYIDGMVSPATQLVSSLGPTVLNELRVQYARRHFYRFSHDPNVTGVSVNVNGGTVNGVSQAINFGMPTGDGEDFVQRITQVIDNVTYLRGTHSYKTGVDVQWIGDHREVPLPAQYNFASIQAYNDAKSGLSPRGYTTFTQTIGQPAFNMNNAMLSLFGQDDWRMTPTFKLLYGLRYDYYMYPGGIDGAPYNATFHRDGNNVAPRAGFAWTLDGQSRMVLRGSSGLMYDQPLLAIVETAYTNSGLAQRTTSVSLNPTSPNAPSFPNTLSGLPPGTVQVSATVQGMAPDFQTGKVWQNDLTLERAFGANYSASIGARYARGWNLPVINDVNLAGVAPVRYLDDGRGVYATAVNASTRVDPRYNRVRLTQSIGESWYKALTLQLTKRWSRGVQYNLNYTLAKGTDTAPLGGATLAVQGDASRVDPVRLDLDRGPNQLDIRHTFNGSIVAISSVTRFSPWLNKILTDNQAGVILQFNSGIPDGIQGTLDLNFDGNNNDRPVTETRNDMYVPTRWNIDMRYSRFFQLGHNRRLEVQAEFKNLFNIEQVAAVNNTLTVDADGYVIDPTTRVRVPADSISHSGADYPATSGREQRKFQLGFKVFF
jgi:hypothetical protein